MNVSVKVGDYRIPENGCLEFRDKIAHAGGSGCPDFKFVDFVRRASRNPLDILKCSQELETVPNLSLPLCQPDLFSVGIYPVEIVKDPRGLVTCV